MRKLVVSIHATANDIVTGPPSDETNFMVWAQAGIEDSLDSFWKSLATVDRILLGRATYQDLVRNWPKVRGLMYPISHYASEKRSTARQKSSVSRRSNVARSWSHTRGLAEWPPEGALR